MITITKEGNECYPDIRIFDGIKSFLIKRMNAPDLYWIPDFHPLDDNENIKFIINETDGVIYTLFESLYNDVITGNIFPLKMEDIKDKPANEIRRLQNENMEQKKRYQKLAYDTNLVKDNIITWHSEDYDSFESAAVLTIEKNESQIEIIFSKNKDDEYNFQYRPTYVIRISESWGIYQNFFCPFVILHRQLQALALEKVNFTDEVIFSKKKNKM